jgi:DNA-binding NarL/FixJ family response regulator
METTRIIFTDNVERYRRVILAELSSFGISCIGEASNGLELLKLLVKKQPDVVLLDLEMPIMDGNEALNHILEKFPATKVVILSMHYEQILVENYIQRGARGYVSKDEIAGNTRLLADAIEEVKHGNIFVHHLSQRMQMDHIPYSSRMKELAPMVCQGLTNEQIASKLHMGVRGVEKLRSKLYSKINGGRAVDFYRYAFSRGLQFLGYYKQRKKQAAKSKPVVKD